MNTLTSSLITLANILLNARTIRVLILSTFSLYWLVLLHIPWPNNGDYGMNLPMNLLCWGVMSMLSLLVWLFLRTATVRITRTSILMLASAVLFTLPILWSPSEGLPTALPRLVGIWGGVMCYVTLLQVPLQEKETTGIFYLLAIAAVVECLISLAGIYCPAYLPFPLNNLAENYSGYAPGIFQQLNVTASFLATGLVALLFVLADARCVCYRVRAESYRLLFICVSIIVISATLVVFHSRTGWLGGLIGILCVSVMFSHPRFRVRTTRCRRLLVVLLPFAGGLLGTLLLNQPLDASLAHESSSNQRMLTLEYTLRMIDVHPWRGWGLGMFEPAFQNFMAALPSDNPSREMMQHPHNETLFIWAEGGVMALAGGLCLLWGWIILFLRRKSLWQWAALLTTLPILLHTQVEFPLYYSVAHYFAILILMASADGELRTFQVRSSRLRWPLVFIALYGLVLSAQLFFASIVLGNFETGRLAFPESITGLHVPGLMQMRYQRDLSQLHLWHFNQTGDIDELERYAKENGEWIKLHMEEDAWNDQVNILLFSHRQGDAEKLKQRAHRLMPWDVRFKP
ncbi:O-antigen ligase family protein [Enterobacter asburiae]|uniref:O-antigen ligase family protein n=1 Tax=Enterobacter asburiae TaxID=61645 RepID=UPI001B388ECE|nr:O-antigen ligase family protein [Enterobacter asburiae]MBQ0319303.1 O-antigen ligase C-terminal domain-containing protein [Enterobacter asburiae]HDX4011867.1 O-antigen ligase C-terminal domain-containing protein [Enterobacter asburiae]